MICLSLQSRIKGSIYGVAVVDALGGPVEFQPRGSFELVSSFQHNENFDVPPGTWTDDTSMTLCLAKSLIDSKDTSRLRATALISVPAQPPHLLKDNPAAHEGGQPAIDKALKQESFCGNGSLMRVSPIGLVYFRDMNEALYYTAASSEVTHPYPTSAECCMIYTKLIVLSLNGTSKEGLVRAIANTKIKDAKIKQRLSGYTSLAEWEAKDENGIKSSTISAHLQWGYHGVNGYQSTLNTSHCGNSTTTTLGSLDDGIYRI
ncbi:ADP-ribosylation/Crystallin J1 [Aspergillus spectabilis]